SPTTSASAPPLYALSLHDALPIFLEPLQAPADRTDLSRDRHLVKVSVIDAHWMAVARGEEPADLVLSGGHVLSVFTKEWLDVDVDRKSTRLNSSHVAIPYAGFCLK